MSSFLGLNFSSPLWALARQPGSFRGVPFVVLENSLRRGRQTVLHTYPFRDDPWPEDIGRSPRVTSFRGFVIGDDADGQIQSLIEATEKAGPGQLTHPIIGSVLVSIVAFTASDDPRRGRMWSFEMSVVPYIARIYPVAEANTRNKTSGLFGSFGAAVAKDFAAVKTAIGEVRSAVTGVVTTVQGFAAQGFSLVRDASVIAHIPASLSGNFGRFGGGGGALTSIPAATGAATTAISSADRIGSTLGSLASRL